VLLGLSIRHSIATYYSKSIRPSRGYLFGLFYNLVSDYSLASPRVSSTRLFSRPVEKTEVQNNHKSQLNPFLNTANYLILSGRSTILLGLDISPPPLLPTNSANIFFFLLLLFFSISSQF
jgi:hypothetical protein